MAVLKLLAVSSLAILFCSFGPNPTSAVSLHHQVSRHVVRDHSSLLIRATPPDRKRCKPRPASSSSKSSAPKSTPKPKPKPDAPDGGSPPPDPGPGNSGKFGIAWALGNDPALANFRRNKPTVVYTWSPYIPKLSGFTGVPMLWGDKQVADFKRLVKAGYANTVLGFNEPNQRGQADITPQRGADLWREYIEPLVHQGYRTGSPSTTSAPSGMTWMKAFFTACRGCTVNFVTIHYYDVDPDDFIKYIKSFRDAFHRPIWVTEYACQNFNNGPQCTESQTFNFHQRAINFMNSQDWIEHFFPFGVMHDMSGVNALNRLLAGNGSPTALGRMYLNS